MTKSHSGPESPSMLVVGEVLGGQLAVSADARSAARGSAALAVVQVSSRLLGLLFILVTSRLMSADQFGRYSIVAALVLIGGLLADFGTTPAITRHITRHPEQSDSVLSGTLLLSVGLGLLAWMLVVAFVASAGYARVTLVDAVIGGVALPFSSAASSITGSLDGAGLIARRSLVTFSQPVVSFGLGAVAIAAGAGIRWAIAAMAAGPMVGLLLAGHIAIARGIWHGSVRPDWAWCRALLRVAFPFALLGSLSALSSRFDVTLLSVLRSRSETADYDLALRITEATLGLGVVLTAPALYIFSGRLGVGDRDGAARAFHQASRLAYLMGLPVSAIIGALAQPLTDTIFGPSYRGVAAPLAIVATTSWLSFVGLLQGSLIMGGDDLRGGLAVSGVIVAITVALDIGLIAPYGVQGGAVAIALTSVITVVGFAWLHRARSGIPVPFPPLGAILAALAAGGAAWSLRGGPLGVSILLGFGAYLLLLVVTGTVRTADIRRIHALLGREATAPQQ